MLIAIAAVGSFLVLMFLWFLAALVFRLRFQFSLLVAVRADVVVALPFSWLATEMKAAREQKEAVEEIKKLVGTVCYDYQHDQSVTDTYVHSRRGRRGCGGCWGTTCS